MKTITTFLVCIFCILTGFAQTDFNVNIINLPEKTPELQALYLQARHLENTGTAIEINTNRLAIKNAWQQVNPAVAALYMPLEQVVNAFKMVEREISPQNQKPIHRSPVDWDTDLLLRDGFIDGLDMDVTSEGDIYIAAFENATGSNGVNSEIFVYRSTDNGNSFQLWKNITSNNVQLTKLKTLTIAGKGDDYLLLYILDNNGVLQVARWDLVTGNYDYDVIANGVIDFGVDRNYPANTSAQRVFATYYKTDSACTLGGKLYSARSSAGSYGFDWIDEVSIDNGCGLQVDFAYGADEGCYTVFSHSNGVISATANPSYNDPASWEQKDNVAFPNSMESRNPTIAATRSNFAVDKVLVLFSARNPGSTDQFEGIAYFRENNSSYGSAVKFASISANTIVDVSHIGAWVKRASGSSVQTSFVFDYRNNSENDRSYSRNYDGVDWVGYEHVSDLNINVFDGFASAIAETSDGMPCMTFAGTTEDVYRGHSLYFDRKSTLGVDENGLEAFNFYPNPAQDFINLSAIDTIENVSIYSLTGQRVIEFSQKYKSPSLNISFLAPGIYVMKVEVDGQTGCYKIIKE